MSKSLKQMVNNVSDFTETSYDNIYANLFGYKKKYRQRKEENKSELLFLLIGGIFVIFGIFWFVNETKEKNIYFYTKATTLSSKDERNNIYVSYNYGFSEMTNIVEVPFYVDVKENMEIPVKFLKDDVSFVKYGKDTRLVGVCSGLLGTGIIFISIMSLEGKEEKRKLKDHKAVNLFKNEIRNNKQ